MPRKGRGRDRNSSAWWGDGVNWYIGDFLPAWTLPSGETLQGSEDATFTTEFDGQELYLPLYINNDGFGNTATGLNDDDGLDTFILTIDPDDPTVGFSQETYLLKESWDPIAGDAPLPNLYSAPPSGDPSQLAILQDYKNKTFLVNQNSVDPSGNPIAAPKLVKGGPFRQTTILIEDAQSPAPIQLGSGNDVIPSSSFPNTSGMDIIYAGAGDDQIDVGANDDTVRGEQGNDRLLGGDGDDLLYGEAGDDTIRGGNSRTVAQPESSAYRRVAGDYLNGGSGNDTLYGEGGWDFLDGMMGNDVLYGDFETPQPTSGTRTAVDILYGGYGEDRLYGGIDGDTLDGGVDNDLLWGETGNDRLIGGYGNDILYGGVDSDSLFGDDDSNDTGAVGDDQLYGEAGIDFLQGGKGNDLLNAGADKVNSSSSDPFSNGERLDGGEGFDIADYHDLVSGFAVGITAYLQTDGGEAGQGQVAFRDDSALDRLINVEGIIGSTGNDFLYGTDGDNRLDGYLGIDTLTGKNGNDTYVVDNPGDQIIDAPQTGIETVESSITWTLQPGLDHLTLVGNAAINGAGNNLNNILRGNTASNYLVGGEGDDTLDGGAGNDTLEGGTGNDVYVVDSTGDTIADTPQTGIETVQAAVSWTLQPGLDHLTLIGEGTIDGTGNDLPNQMQGNGSNNFLSGSAGDDTIDGQDGNDILAGGAGTDTLVGGTGVNRFVFYDPATDGTDRITDFKVGGDRIGLYVGAGTSGFRRAGFAVNRAIRADQFRVGAAAGSTTDRIIYNSDSGDLFFDADGTGSTAQVKIATLAAGLPLSNQHIIAFDGTNAIAPPDADTDSGSGGNDPGGNPQGGNGSGDDTIVPGQRIAGTAGKNRLKGGDGDDTIESKGGNDILRGGLGSDRLIGGKGRDVFLIERGEGTDTIQDFKDGSDRLGISKNIKVNKLKIQKYGKDSTLISFKNDSMAIALGIKPNLITAADFVIANPF